MTLSFGAPEWLWGLLSLPFVALLFWWGHRRSRVALSRFIPERLQPLLVETVHLGVRIARQVLMIAAIAALLFALAKPRGGFETREVMESGRDILIAVDVSKSMLAQDVTPTRLLRAKLAVQDLLDDLPGDRFGLIAFAGSAFLQAPLTLDHAAVSNALQELDTEVIPRGGTNLAAAIQVALQAFGKAEGADRALVLLTDGEELDADGLLAAKEAAAKGVRIYTIGVGSPEGAEIRVPRPDGGYDYVRDNSGNPVRSRLDENRLREIAQAGDGFYLRLSPDAIPELIRRGLEQMAEATGETGSQRLPLERYQWPLGVALFLLFAWYMLSERRRRTPHTATLGLACLFTFAVSHPAPAAQAPPSDGLSLYQEGKFPEALEAFARQGEADSQRPEWSFNAGSAAYKAGQFDRALAEFGAALASDDDALQTASRYNLGNTLFRKGQAAKEDADRKAHWREAITQYDKVLEQKPDDPDATYNRELVTRLLAELEKEEEQQQQQQQQQQNQQEPNQDQEDQSQQDQQKQDQPSQEGQDPQPQNQPQEGEQNQPQDAKNQQKNDPQDQKGQSQDQGKNADQPQEGTESGENQPQDRPEQQDEEGGQNEPQDQPEPDPADPSESGQGQDEQPQDGRPKPGDENPSDDTRQDPGDPSKQGQPNADQQGEPPPVPESVDQGEGERPEGDLQAREQGGPPETSKEGPESRVERGGQLSEAEARALLNALKGEDDTVFLYDNNRNRSPVTRDW